MKRERATIIRKTFRGVVVRDAMEKTIVVRVTRTRWHAKYHKQYRVSRTFHVHDPNNSCHVGDVVEFVPSRPLSKTKRWCLVRKVERP